MMRVLSATAGDTAEERKAQPYAVLDLGGASTQIVFQPTFEMAKPDASLEEGEHKYELRYDGATRPTMPPALSTAST